MPCKRIGNAIVCSGNVVHYDGYLIEFPPIGSPCMLDLKTQEPVEFDDTPEKFWSAVYRYQSQELQDENNALKAELGNYKSNWDALSKDALDFEAENKKLNVILYHRENGLSHPDLQDEIDKSKFAELKAKLEYIKDGVELAIDYLPESPDKAKSFLEGALKGE